MGQRLKSSTSYTPLTLLLRLFIYAERTGDFALHIDCLELIILIFPSMEQIAAYDRVHTRLYIHQMTHLHETFFTYNNIF